MLIVLGGTLAATSVAFRLNEVVRIFSLIKFALTKPKFILPDVVKELIELSELNRIGPAELENSLPNGEPASESVVSFSTVKENG